MEDAKKEDSPKRDPINYEISKKIGERIRTERDLLDLNQAELAAALHYKNNTISKYEKTGEGINFRIVEEAAKFFGLHPGFFYGYQAMKQPIPHFQERVKNLLDQKGITEQELYEQLKRRFEYLSEPDDIYRLVSIEILLALADRFQVSLDDLAGHSVSETIQTMHDKLAHGSVLDIDHAPLPEEERQFLIKLLDVYISSRRK